MYRLPAADMWAAGLVLLLLTGGEPHTCSPLPFNSDP